MTAGNRSPAAAPPRHVTSSTAYRFSLPLPCACACSRKQELPRPAVHTISPRRAASLSNFSTIVIWTSVGMAVRERNDTGNKGFRAECAARQNIHFRWIEIRALPELLECLWRSGLTTMKSCADVASTLIRTSGHCLVGHWPRAVHASSLGIWCACKSVN